ncbi:hypothetical protein HJFPF1_11766 [Paramyrothecium foliicola]|nr:hypothetical protein HJFPF1_11766 [Paramyrothecium foliicola]
MWAANLPYYSEYQSSKRKPSVATKDADNLSPTTSPTRPGHSAGQLSPRSINQAFEPAVDGPPSPERLRQLSKQMKRASHLNRPHGPRAVSSSSNSPSLRSLTGDRPSWEVALENMSLSRRPSNRSTGSSAPSRDRPESMQVFGKSFLHRRGKANRESGSHSSGSSMYSAEMPVDSVPSLKDSIIPALFTKRPSRDESAQRRVQISGPFNFQHVTHTNRDDFPGSQRDRRADSVSEDALTQASDSGSAMTARHGFPGNDHHFDDFSSEHTEVPASRAPMLSRYTGPAPGPRRSMRHIRSQDQLRSSAAQSQRRPSLPPLEPSACPPMPPMPPPRLSSRQSLQTDEDVDPLSPTVMDRPLTSGGYRRPQLHSPTESIGQPAASPRALGYEPPNFDGFSFGRPTSSSHALTTPDDSAWPLGPGPAAFDSPLADVPEEEEHHGVTRRSRVSLASNNSSLRGSHSVPALRSLAQSQQRTSETSETLEALSEAQASPLGNQFDHDAALWDGNWEDDIDYCYEHEVEANCDYQWERASVDVSRDRLPPAVQLALAEDELAEAKPIHSSNNFPSMLLAAQSEVPALSPVSLASTTASQDVSTPVFNPGTGNFSLPRGERKQHKLSTLKQIRPVSNSSFRESQGFTLSPSLLIPGDYHHQMLEKNGYIEDDEFVQPIYDHHEAMMSRNSSSLMPQRVSTSTTETNSTTHTDFTGERHISTTSTWSSLTRHTASSTSLNKMATSWTENEQLVEREEEERKADSRLMPEIDEQRSLQLAATDTVPELMPFPNASFGRKSSHRSHASESVTRSDVAALQSTEQPVTRRPRARTTSVSTQAPPIGGYSLFPRDYPKPPIERV